LQNADPRRFQQLSINPRIPARFWTAPVHWRFRSRNALKSARRLAHSKTLTRFLVAVGLPSTRKVPIYLSVKRHEGVEGAFERSHTDFLAETTSVRCDRRGHGSFEARLAQQVRARIDQGFVTRICVDAVRKGAQRVIPDTVLCVNPGH